jgi:hypothetical protein
MGTHTFFSSFRLLIYILTGSAGASESHDWIFGLALGIGATARSAPSTATGRIALLPNEAKRVFIFNTLAFFGDQPSQITLGGQGITAYDRTWWAVGWFREVKGACTPVVIVAPSVLSVSR